MSLSSISVISPSSSSFTLGDASDTSEESTEGASAVFPVLAEKDKRELPTFANAELLCLGGESPSGILQQRRCTCYPPKGSAFDLDSWDITALLSFPAGKDQRSRRKDH